MGTTRLGTQLVEGISKVALSGGSGAATPVRFRFPFVGIPQVFVVSHKGDEDAVLDVSLITTTGFVLTVTGTGLPDGDVLFLWVAAEKT